MGWFSNSIYGGDGTQSCHYDFIKWAKIKVSQDKMSEWIGHKKTIIPKEYHKIFKSNLKLIESKMPKVKFWNDYNSIDWQMLLALCLDNNIKPTRLIRKNGIEATKFLIEEHAKNFNNPYARKKVLKNFMKKINEKL